MSNEILRPGIPMSPLNTGAHGNAKIAIPRQRSNAAPRLSRRVPRACESCRIRKTKCSGDTPSCRQCRELRVANAFHICAAFTLANSKTRQQEELFKKLQFSQSLLKEAEQFVPGRTAKRIQEFLQDSDSGYVSNDFNGDKVREGPAETSQEAGYEPASSDSSLGSLNALDEVEYDVNLTKESRATGYIGKSSEITWMQRLQQEILQCTNTFDKDYTAGNYLGPHEINYHLDDFDIGVSEPVQMYWVPPRSLADRLLDTYLHVAHPYIPILNRPLFCSQYERFFDRPNLPGDKWMAILNIVFAIAATYAHTAELNWRGDPKDHLLYLTRARMLSMGGDEVFRHPDLQQVQVEGLMAFYLLSTDQIHRAWRMSALAIRSAVALGINLKSSNPMITNVSKEVRNRVWWSLITIENKLSLMTGRPNCISVSMCASPFPLPFEEQELDKEPATSLLNDPQYRDRQINDAMSSSYFRRAPFTRFRNERHTPSPPEWLQCLPVSTGLYFLYSCDLTILVQELLDRVYAVDAVHQPWRDLKSRIDEIRERVDIWLGSLPPDLDFTRLDDYNQAPDEMTRLAFQYHSARMMLGRPCLCRQHKEISQSTNEEYVFTKSMAVSAIRSAIQMAHLIPDEAKASDLEGICHWWCLLHYAMQTITIIILEISYDCIHLPEAASILLQLAIKCIRWLHRMSRHSVAAHRAWQLCDSSLRRLALPMNLDVSDLPSRPYRQQPVDTNSFALDSVELHPTAATDTEMRESNTPGPGVELNTPQLIIQADSTAGPRTNTSLLAAAGGVDPWHFAHDRLDDSFVDLFFPEL
ncbi:transcriptional regulator family: Fungal Specific TF [Penicillium sp. IBT 35674x]|nr:transcriptional regulator family: Fungal Specific TF [Penicillium sp. IBT 35674x]